MYNLNIILLIISFFLVSVGIIVIFSAIFQTVNAEKKLKVLIRKNSKMRKQLIEDFTAAQKGDDKKLSELQEALKKELSAMDNDLEKKRILDILNNGTRESKVRFIIGLLT